MTAFMSYEEFKRCILVYIYINEKLLAVYSTKTEEDIAKIVKAIKEDAFVTRFDVIKLEFSFPVKSDVGRRCGL